MSTDGPHDGASTALQRELEQARQELKEEREEGCDCRYCNHTIPGREVYRCVDCDQTFHKDCLHTHCANDLATALARAESAERERESFRKCIRDLLNTAHVDWERDSAEYGWACDAARELLERK